jgi:dihydropyrimidine dehydrogenase (NAD+) subunit PreA
MLASATPGADGIHCHEAWLGGAGAVVPKSLAPPVEFARHPRAGRMKLIRHGRSRLGMVNMELFSTKSLEEWLEADLAQASAGGACVVASVVAHADPMRTAGNAEAIERTGNVAMFEINVSCPMPADRSRVGFQMGNDPNACAAQVAAVKKAVGLPVGVKLTPTTHDMVPMAVASQEAGADFLTVGNSIRAFGGVEVETGMPHLPAYGGYSGPAIKPITQRHVSEVARAVSIPIVACGGVSTWEDIVEYVMLGASAVQLCTSIMWEGYRHFEALLTDLERYVERRGLNCLDEVRGMALPHIKTIAEAALAPPLVATVDPTTCTNLLKGGCERCRPVCFYGAIEFAPRLLITPAFCDGCGLCVEICPVGALELRSPAQGHEAEPSHRERM